MPSYTTSLRLVQPTTGEYPGTWGTQVNTGLTALVDTSVAGTATITMTAANYTLSVVNGASDESRAAILSLGGTPGGSYQVIVPALSKLYVVVNNTGFAQTVKTSGGSGVSVPNGATAYLRCDGTNVVAALNYLGSLTLGAALPIASGGTGSTSTTYCSLTTNVTGTLPVGNGGTGATTLTGVVKGNGTSAFTAGTVNLASEVSGTLPVGSGGTGNTTIPARSIFVANVLNTLTTVTATAGQSIRVNAGGTAWEAYTSAAGDAVLANNNAFTGANTFYNATGQTFGTGTAAQDGIIIAGRAGGTSTYRVTLSPGTLTANRAITFPNAAGELVVDTATQTLTNKTLTSPTLTTPALGTPASGVLTNCTGTAVGLTAGNLTQTTVGTAISATTAATGSVTASGAISLSTGASTSSGNTGAITIATGTANNSSSGDITIATGTVAGTAATGGAINITAGSGISSITNGGAVTIRSGNGLSSVTNSSGTGGDISLLAGESISFGGNSANHKGGRVIITGGASDDITGTGGNIQITAGAATGNSGGAGNLAGNVTITGGAATAASGGSVSITGGASTLYTGGDIKLTPGAGGSATGKIDFINCNVANGTVATTITSLGPTGSSTTIQGWLAIKINGTARYIPFW